MILIIVFGALAALYLAVLLHRLAIHALPVGTGLIVASQLQNAGWNWGDAAPAASLAGLAIYCVGRVFATDAAGMAVRFPIRLIFSGAAACAGYQLGTALAVLGELDADWRRILALCFAVTTAHASWRDLSRPRGCPAPRPER